METVGTTHIKVEFDYQGTSLALDRARIAPDYDLFTGTQLFLQVKGHRDNPCTVRFEIPEAGGL